MADDEDHSTEHVTEPADTTAGAATAGIELLQNKELYQMLFFAHPDGMMLSVEGKIAMINDRFAEMSLYTPKEAIGMAPSEMVVAEDREHAKERVRALLNKGAAYRSTYMLLRKDGTKLPMDALSSPLQHDGKAAIITVVRDISEQLRAEQTLRAFEEERYRHLLEVAPDGIVIVDGAGVIETVNARVEKLFGYDRSELIGRPIEMLIPERFSQGHPALRQAYSSAPHARVMGPALDLYGLRKDGSEFRLDVNLNAMLAETGTSIIATVRDMTEYFEAQQALRESEGTNRALLAAMPDMIFRMARDGTYLNFVPGTEAAPHLPPSEFLGRNVREVVPHMADDILHAIDRALKTHETQTLSFDNAFDDGLRSVELRINFCSENEVLLITRDVTERAEAEKALRESEARFSTAFHDNPIPVTISRISDGKLIDLNDAFLGLTGYRRSETAGRTPQELGVLVDAIEPEALIEAVRKRGTVRDIPGQIKTKTGDLLDVLGTATQIELEGEPCLLITIVDITARKRLEAELQEMRDDLGSKVEREMDRGNVYKLTFREFTVLHLISDGKADKEISAELAISVYTVHRHVSNILAKMDSPSRTEAGTRALRERLID